MNARQIIRMLGLGPHPEGGHYIETWRHAGPGRPSGTCIYFLLQSGETSHWHHVDATEIWHHYLGAPLNLTISPTEQGPAEVIGLGPDLAAGQRPQVVVPAHHWQMARTTGEFTLAGCTVSPGFQFDGFTLAEPGFDIPLKS